MNLVQTDIKKYCRWLFNAVFESVSNKNGSFISKII